MSLHTYLSIIFILTHPFAVSPSKDPKSDASSSSTSYGVLLDAGSSSTKLKVYKWDPPADCALVPKIVLISDGRFDGGLGNYEHDSKGLTQYLQEILKKAKKDVPKSKHAVTPIYLMATAGLRFLTSADASVFLEKTRVVMANRTINPFSYKPSSVSILSGEEEGVYSWIAANYLLGFFDQNRSDNESMGVLEMGGGSTQIAFIPNGPIFSEEYQVILAGHPYQLYVQSYLQFGSNAIRLQVAHQLSQRNVGQMAVNNPCMLRSDTRKTTLEDGTVLTEVGSGGPLMCLDILKQLLSPYTDIRCQPKPCAIGSVHQPSVDNLKFVATQAFEYTPKSLKAVDTSKILNIDKLEREAIRHCNRSLREATNSGFNEALASADCLMGLYIPTLLTVSYGFNRNTTNIKLTTDIGKEKIDWALGAMLVELSSSFGSSKSDYSVSCKTGAKPLPAYDYHANFSPPAYSWTAGIVLCITSFIISSYNDVILF